MESPANEISRQTLLPIVCVLEMQIISLARLEFFNGFRIATFILAIIDAVAIIPSAVRGQDTPARYQMVRGEPQGPA